MWTSKGQITYNFVDDFGEKGLHLQNWYHQIAAPIILNTASVRLIVPMHRVLERISSQKKRERRNDYALRIGRIITQVGGIKLMLGLFPRLHHFHCHFSESQSPLHEMFPK